MISRAIYKVCELYVLPFSAVIAKELAPSAVSVLGRGLAAKLKKLGGL
jgi:hypothetical protein